MSSFSIIRNQSAAFLPFLILFVTATAASPGPRDVPARSAPDVTRTLPYHPFRHVGSRYYSLAPLYKWIAAHQPGEARPMPEWIGAAGDHLTFYKVTDILDGGVLLTYHWFLPSGQYCESQQPIFLAHYPFADRLVDGQEIQFLALRAGTFKYTDVNGGSHVVMAYDYGIPYDPNILLQQSRTNKTQ